jgi:hypothetical protein
MEYPMSRLMLVLSFFSILSSSAFAREIRSDREAAQANLARVVQLVTLVAKPDLRVAVAVKDLGGSTDVSPTQRAFFTLYSKGEMFSTDAAFDLGPVFSVKSARRVSGGKYEVSVVAPDENGMPVPATWKIDAIAAITKLREVRCDDFDCDASRNFSASIDVN